MNFPVYRPQVGQQIDQHRVPQASPLAFGFGTSRALEQLGQTIEVVGNEYTRIQERRVLAESHAEAAKLKAQFELSADLYTSELKQTEQDPDAYWTKQNEYMKGLADSVGALATKKYTGGILANTLPETIRTRQSHAITHVDQLRGASRDAELDVTGDTIAARGAISSYSDTKAQADLYGELVSAAADAHARGLPQDKAYAWLKKRSTELVLGAATQEKDNDPEGFLAHPDRYAATPDGKGPGLDGVTLERLKREAEARQAHLATEARLRQKELDVELQKAVDHWHDNNVGTIEKAIMDRSPDGSRLLEFYGPDGLNSLKSGEYLRLRKLQESPPVQKSDPATLREVIAGVAAYPQTMSVAQIGAYHAQGLLSDEDLRVYSNRARDKKDTVPETEKHDYQEVTNIAGLLLSKRTDKFAMVDDDKSKELKARFRLALLNNSQYHNGREPSKDVMYRVLPGLVRELNAHYNDDLKNQQAAIAKLPYQSADALKAALDAKKIKPKEYEEMKRQMDALAWTIDKYEAFTRESNDMFRRPPGR